MKHPYTSVTPEVHAKRPWDQLGGPRRTRFQRWLRRNSEFLRASRDWSFGLRSLSWFFRPKWHVGKAAFYAGCPPQFWPPGLQWADLLTMRGEQRYRCPICKAWKERRQVLFHVGDLHKELLERHQRLMSDGSKRAVYYPWPQICIACLNTFRALSRRLNDADVLSADILEFKQEIRAHENRIVAQETA